MSKAYWSDACRSAGSRPLQTLLASARASCSITVTRAAAVPLIAVRHFCLQHLCDARCRTDSCVLRLRLGQRSHVLSLAAPGRGRTTAHVAVLRHVQRTYALRQLLRDRLLVGSNDEFRVSISRQPSAFDRRPRSVFFILLQCHSWALGFCGHVPV